MIECSRWRRRRQMVDTKELPQRARYYQSVDDGVALSKGGFYTNLKDQYIIFLSPKDIFNHGFPVYHFENRAREDSNITLGDRTFKNFYIFNKYEEFENPVVKAYMKYFATRNADSRETETIDDQVSYYKADTLIRNKYMTYEFDLHESKEEGRAEGKKEGKLEMVDAMFANPKLTDEDIASISGFSLDEIRKRRAQRWYQQRYRFHKQSFQARLLCQAFFIPITIEGFGKSFAEITQGSSLQNSKSWEAA